MTQSQSKMAQHDPWKMHCNCQISTYTPLTHASEVDEAKNWIDISLQTYFDVQEDTKDETSKDKCWKNLPQMVINYCGIENSKPEYIKLSTWTSSKNTCIKFSWNWSVEFKLELSPLIIKHRSLYTCILKKFV